MKHLADDWPKALLDGVMVSAIIFLALLPYFGRAWHRVLPEHGHLFVGTGSGLEQDILSGLISITRQGAQFDPGDPVAAVIHLPDPTGTLQVFTVAIVLTGTLFIFVSTGFSSRVIPSPICYTPALIPPPDPPPTVN